MLALIGLGVATKNPVSNISKNFLDMREKKVVLAYYSQKILISFHNSKKLKNCDLSLGRAIKVSRLVKMLE
jgi:hypothetical protein